MADTPQSFANHTRWHPPFHFFVVPVLLINFIWAIVNYFKYPGWNSGWWIVVSLALVVLMFVTRLNSLKVQDRLIRLEEQLRCQRVLSPSIAKLTTALPTPQLIALRFAGDDELEELVNAVVAGKFATPKDIKRAIKNWRADTFRV